MEASDRWREPCGKMGLPLTYKLPEPQFRVHTLLGMLEWPRFKWWESRWNWQQVGLGSGKDHDGEGVSL